MTQTRTDTRAERAQAEAATPTRAQRLAAVMAKLSGDAWRFITHVDGELELQVDSTGGDRYVGRGATHEAALAALEQKVSNV